MDWYEIIAAIATFLLGLGGVATFINNKMAKVLEIVNGIKEVLELVTVSMNSLKDGKLTNDEVKQIEKEFNDVKALYKAWFGKKVTQ